MYSVGTISLQPIPSHRVLSTLVDIATTIRANMYPVRAQACCKLLVRSMDFKAETPTTNASRKLSVGGY